MQEVFAQEGELTDYGPGILLPTATFRKRVKNPSYTKGGNEPEFMVIDDGSGTGVEWLALGQGGEQRLVLELGKMTEPMAAMRKCTNELLTH